MIVKGTGSNDKNKLKEKKQSINTHKTQRCGYDSLKRKREGK